MEVDGHNIEKVLEAIQTAKKDVERPTLICCKTIIGFGSPNKSGTSGVHGAALGEDEVKKTRVELGWDHEPFHIPDEIKSEWDGKVAGAELNASWDKLMKDYSEKHPESFKELKRVINNELPINFEDTYKDFIYELSPTFTFGPNTTYGSTVSFLPYKVSFDRNIVSGAIILTPFFKALFSLIKSATLELI